MKTLADKTLEYWKLMCIWNARPEVKENVTTGAALKRLGALYNQTGPHRKLSSRVDILREAVIVGENPRKRSTGE